MRRWIPALVSFLAASSSAWAQVPEKISFQGKLSNAQNQPVNGSVAMVFRLYAGPSGGSPVWSESQTVPVVNGIYAAYLGESNPLGGIPFDAPYWLSVEVNGDGEMTPRYMLSASPYSLRSRKANALEGLTVPLSQLNQLNGIGGTVTGANLNRLTDGSNADGLHVHDWGAITGKPLAFPPTPHVHGAADLTSGTLPDGRLIGTYTGALTLSNAGNSIAGSFTGNGAGLTGVNATTVTNGLYTTGAYADPPWITSLSGGKITGSVNSATNASQLGGVGAASYARLDQAQTFTGGTQNIQSAGAAQSALILRGVSGQTANLQEWRDASGGVLAAIDASGAFTGTAATSSNLASGTYSNAVTFSNVANSFAGSGAGLTSLSASSLATGSLPNGRLAGTYGSALTFSNASNSFTGSGAGLTSLNPANLSAGTAGINITGNAATVTNGVTTTGSYADPAWITSLAGSKISGAVATALTANTATTVTNGVYTTGSYADPAWITSLSGGKISGAVTTALNANNATTVTNGVYTTGSYGDPAWITSISGGKITGPVASATNASQLGGLGATSYARLDQGQTFSGGTQSIVSPAAAQQALILQSATGQTANLQEWRNDSGGLLAAVDATGAFTGTAASASTASSLTAGTYSNAVTFTNTANSFAGSGAGLTSLSASSLATGSLPTGRLAGTYGSALTFSNASNSFTGTGTGLTNLNPANLGAGTAGINVTGTAGNVAGTVAIANGGTGATTVSGARTNLGAAQSGANSDITSIAGLATPLTLGQGGTGATTPAAALANLGGVSLASANTFTTGAQTVLTGADTNRGIVIRGNSPSQVANLQEWQDSSGGVRTYLAPDGRFIASSTTGSAIFGSTTASGSVYGVVGSASDTGFGGVLGTGLRGVTGQALGPTGVNYGVYGTTGSPDGIAVYGEVGTAMPGAGVGVKGVSSAVDGVGVYGQASSPTGYGLYTPNRAHVGGDLTVVGTINGSGSSLTNLNASNLNAGTVPDARLSTNVALRSGSQTFSGTQTIQTGGAGNPGLRIQGAPGQTEALQEWRDAAGVAIASVGSNGAVAAPAFSGSGLGLTDLDASKVTLGTLSALRGGTGQAGYAPGDLLYGADPFNLSKLAIGAAGTVLTSAGGLPAWGAANAHDHNGQTWVSSLTRPLRIHTDNTTNGTAAVLGWATGLTGEAWGLYGRSESNNGRGVFGFSTATTGNPSGVLGEASGPTSRGVTGFATDASGGNIGVYGLSQSTAGTGVYGHAATSTGINYGVFGRTSSGTGFGVYGVNLSTSGSAAGVFGKSDSSLGVGVWGESPATGGMAGVYGASGGNGVFGVTDSDSGVGVRGYARSNTGSTVGVLGQSEATSGYGVWASATAPTGTTYGVFGLVNSASGYGLYTPNRAHVGGDLSVGGTLSGNGSGLTNVVPADGSVSSAKIQGLPKAQVTTPVPGTLPNASSTALSFSAEAFDVGSMYDGANPTRMTAPTSGYYRLSAQLDTYGSIAGYRTLSFRKNGTTTVGGTSRSAEPNLASETIQSLTITVFLNTGDYIEVLAWQNSGGTLNINSTPTQTFAQIEYVP